MNPSQLHRLDYSDFQSFSSFDLAYINQDSRLTPFLRDWPSTASLKKYADQKSFPQERREQLYLAWKKQFDLLQLWDSVKDLVEKIRQPNTYTIITAHQPVLFGGPLYIMYKIASTIHLARKLKEEMPDKDFLPVFVTGGEDHDKDEMDHLRIFGKTIQWETNQSGSVGRFSNDGLDQVLDQLSEYLKEDGEDIVNLMRQCFNNNRNYGESYQMFIQSLFMEEGLLVLNMDEAILKTQFKPIIEREIFEQLSQSLVHETQEELDAVGFKNQAYAREINLFYISKNGRQQINPKDGSFIIDDEEYDVKKMKGLMDGSISNFSPNVVMRPLYQEYSLPNLAYVGGGGELAYWTERKRQFEAFDISFPLLIRRSSAAWLDSFIVKKMNKVGLKINDLTKDQHALIKEIVSEETELDSKVQAQKTIIQDAFDSLATELDNFDASVATYARAEGKKLEKTLDNLESKIIRSVKKREQDTVRNIERIFDHSFPKGGLQERVDNFLPYYSKFGHDWLQFLIESLDPLDGKMLVVEE